jgi:hypothetical protein
MAGGIAEGVCGFALDIGILVTVRRKLALRQQTEGTTRQPRRSYPLEAAAPRYGGAGRAGRDVHPGGQPLTCRVGSRSMTDMGVPPEQAVRRSRIHAVVHIGVLVACIIGPALVVRPTSDPSVAVFFLALFAGILTAAFPARCKAKGVPRVHGPNRCLITGRTSTGERTIDLRQLKRVTSFVIPSKGSSVEVLVIVDWRGVRLGLADLASYRLVAKAVRTQAKKPGLPAVRVSRRARYLLDAGELPWWRGSLSVLGTIAYSLAISFVSIATALTLAAS